MGQFGNVPGPNGNNEQSRQYAAMVRPAPGNGNINNVSRHNKQDGSGLGLGKILGEDFKSLGIAVIGIFAQLKFLK
jgi:hypothetical protein